MTGPAVRRHSGSRNRTHVPYAAPDYEESYLMARPDDGHVFERPWADGETISYGA